MVTVPSVIFDVPSTPKMTGRKVATAIAHGSLVKVACGVTAFKLPRYCDIDTNEKSPAGVVGFCCPESFVQPEPAVMVCAAVPIPTPAKAYSLGDSALTLDVEAVPELPDPEAV